jgi:hypothetical protein
MIMFSLELIFHKREQDRHHEGESMYGIKPRDHSTHHLTGKPTRIMEIREILPVNAGFSDPFKVFPAHPGSMNVSGFRFMTIVLLAGMIFCGGCSSKTVPEAAPAITPQAAPTGTAAAEITRTAVPLSLLPAPAVTGVQNISLAPSETPVAVTTTWIEKTYGKDAMENPQIVLLNSVKGAKIYDIPDCGMRVAFPQAAGDPAYGIRQTVPKLILLTPEEMDTFETTYSTHPGRYPDTEKYIDPNAIGGAPCAGVPADPRWNFVRINATLIPRNARPQEYDIGINVRSHGVVIEQLQMNQTFVIEQPVIFVRYIPLKIEEMDVFDSIELVFSRRG